MRLLETIERLAELSIARGCGFAGLAIFTVMFGLAWDPVMAFRTGGLLSLLACAVLILKGRNAPRRPYKHTELWVILPKDERPKAEVAQQLIGTVLRDVYFKFARQSAYLGAIMLGASLLASAFGVGPTV
jgi:hypothetical protein